MVLKFSSKRNGKYIRLKFNSYISNDNFFQKSYAYYRHELAFFGKFSRPRGCVQNPDDGKFLHNLTLHTDGLTNENFCQWLQSQAIKEKYR